MQLPANDEELRASEELNRRILEAVPGGIVHIAIDGSILHANAEALRILGLSFDQITKKYTRDFEAVTIREDGSVFPAEEYPATRAMVTGEAQPAVTIGVRRPDGSTSWALYSAVPVRGADNASVAGTVVTILDITARREMECALRESEARLRSLVMSVPMFVLMASADGRVEFVNQTVPGLDPAAMIGQDLYTFVDEKDRELARANVEHVLATGEVAGYESRGSTDIGGRSYRVRVGPVEVSGVRRGVTLVFWDVTDQKSLESRAVLGDRLAAIGTLAAGVAHEINNPLTYLRANLEWLELKRGPTDPDLLWKVQAALEGADRIAAIVRDLGAYAQSREPRVEAVNVREAVESSVRMAGSVLKERARVVCDLVDVPRVCGDRARIGQILLNLLVNAAQSIAPGMPERNEVRIATSVTPEGRVRICVSDTGAGIAPELLGTIFDPFVTTKPVGVGTGLGLHICQHIVQALGGAIWVKSALGQGTTFYVDLPIADRTSEPPRISPLPRARSERRARVLVVDDERNIRATVKDMLDDHDVAEAATGEDALAMLARGHYDAVLCDLVMPSMSGIEVFMRATTRDPALAGRFAFITGGVQDDATAAKLASIDRPIIHKPFSTRELQGAIESLRRAIG